jgi:hypothetical protein
MVEQEHIYIWDNGLETASVQPVTPAETTTYKVTATDGKIVMVEETV